MGGSDKWVMGNRQRETGNRQRKQDGNKWGKREKEREREKKKRERENDGE